MLPEDARVCPVCSSSRVRVDKLTFTDHPTWSAEDEVTDMVCDRCGSHWLTCVAVKILWPAVADESCNLETV